MFRAISESPVGPLCHPWATPVIESHRWQGGPSGENAAGWRLPVKWAVNVGSVFVLLACCCASASAYVEIPYSLGRVIQESTSISIMQVEKVDTERNLIVFRKVKDIKGTLSGDVIKHNIGRGGFHPREWQNIMAWAEPGKTAVFFNNGGASETYIQNYWYQAYAGGEWWGMSHAEPFMLRSFAGTPEKLASAVEAMLAGQEVIVPCMVDGDKNALHLRTAKIQRLRASLKVQDYDATRDFVGWGGDDFRTIAGMPGFTHYAGVSRCDPEAQGVAVADFDGDGRADFCLYGEGKVALFQMSGTSLNEVSLPQVSGARTADWADFNGDGKPDLLLATPAGPRLLTNTGSAFKDETGGLPHESYYNTTAAVWLDYDGDKRPDILLANGFLGLRLYRNLGPDAPPRPVAPAIGKWFYIGPFDYAGGRGFDTVYPPEQQVNLAAQYPGKGGEPAVWREGKFTDGQVNNLALFKPEHNSDCVVYLYRELQFGGAVELPISLGSDDTLTVWLNGQKLLSENVQRGCAPDQNRLTLKLRPGKNQLLLKICQGSGDFAFYYAAQSPPEPVRPLFEDITLKAGLGPHGIGGQVKGDHLAVTDVNGDGRPDFLYSAAGGLLALNTPQGFVEAKNSGIQFVPGRAAPVFGDFNNDKHMDVFVPQRGVCKLFAGDGSGRFVDVTAKSGALAQPLGHAACGTWADFNGDGQLDLLVGCLKGPNRYFRNAGNGTFVDAGDELGLYQRIFNTRGLGVADLNGDRAPDLLLNNEGQESVVLLGNPTRQTVGQVGQK
jgi:hypothetical protein